jgi:hypothetical protein
MNKLLLTLMLALVSTSAMAKTRAKHEWTSIGTGIGTGSEQEVTYYLDFQSFNKQGQNVTVWELMNFETPQVLNAAKGKYLSSKLQIEFDCNKMQSRILSFYMYAGMMGSEDIVYSANFPSSPWEPVLPDTIEKELWSSACVKM